MSIIKKVSLLCISSAVIFLYQVNFVNADGSKPAITNQAEHFYIEDNAVIVESVDSSEYMSQVFAGGVLRFDRRVCIESDVELTVHRKITGITNDNVEVSVKLTSISYGGFKTQECETSTYELEIPVDLPPGNYLYNPEGVDHRGIPVSLPTQRFIVLETIGA